MLPVIDYSVNDVYTIVQEGLGSQVHHTTWEALKVFPQ